jgi:hypothetical protein
LDTPENISKTRLKEYVLCYTEYTHYQRPALEQKYPDAAFALEILSNPFVQDRELGSIRMDAYSDILNGEAIAGVHYKYDRQMDAYVKRHNWD